MKTKEKMIIVICLIIAIIILTMFALARYMTSVNGNVNAGIAKWSFKVNNETDEMFVINLGETRSGVEQQANVEDNYVGPGTAGKFDLEINASGSEASLAYEINMSIDNNNIIFPKNLIFYSDSEMKNAIYHENNVINLNGYINYSDENKIQKKTIYWRWDYETGQTQDKINENDEADSTWVGKTVSLSINVVGRQVTTNPNSNKYTVTFDADGGVIDGYGNSEKVVKTVTYNQAYEEIPEPTRVGYEFAGWQSSENLVSINPSDWNNQSLNINGNEGYFSFRIIPKNYIEVSKSQGYNLTTNIENSIEIRMVHFYDSNKQFISYIEGNKQNNYFSHNMNFVTPDNCYYIKMSLGYNAENITITPNNIVDSGLYLSEFPIMNTTIVTQSKNHRLIAKWIKAE